LNADEHPIDTDNDGEPDGDSTNSKSWMDLDDDNDGYFDNEDVYPKNPNKWEKEEEKGKGFIPGFEIIFFAISIIIILEIKKKQ
jgi:hypothetical protein